jgi:hypothetical protein
MQLARLLFILALCYSALGEQQRTSGSVPVQITLTTGWGYTPLAMEAR